MGTKVGNTNYLALAKSAGLNGGNLMAPVSASTGGAGFGIESAHIINNNIVDDYSKVVMPVTQLVDKFHETLIASNAKASDIVRLRFGMEGRTDTYQSLASQESLLNANASVMHDLHDLVIKSGIPEGKRNGVVAELAAMLDNLEERLRPDYYVREAKLSAGTDEVLISTARLVGAENLGNTLTEGRITRALLTGDFETRRDVLSRTSMAGMESFGIDADKLLSDTRTAMVVILRRAMSSVTRRALHVVPQGDPIVKVAKVHPEIYDLNALKSESRETRGEFIQAISLYHWNKQVITTNVKVVLNKDFDTEDSMYDANSIKVGTKYSLKTLGAKKDASTGIRSPLDHTDAIDEAPRMAFIKILATFNDGTTTTTELLNVSLQQFQKRAEFIAGLDEDDANERVLHRVYKNMSLPSTKDDGATSAIHQIFSTLNTRVRFELAVNASITLWKGDGHTTANVMDVKAVMNSGSAATPAVLTQLGYLTLTPVAFGIDARWREENLRETSTFARMRHSSMVFTIPTGKAFGVSSSIQQQSPGTDQALSSMLNEMINLGNDAKHIAALSSSLASLKARLDPENRVPGDYAEMTKLLTYEYIAGSLVNPTILDLTIDVAALGTETLREQERAEDKTCAVIRQLINCMAHAKTQSLLQRQIEPGEQLVWHGIVGRPLIDLIFSIPLTKQSNQVLNNKSVTGADLEISLPNGDLLRLFGNDQADFINKCWFLPMRSDPQSPLNYATIRDCGVFTSAYTSTNSGAVENRAIATSREVVLPQNPVAICMQFKNLEYFETQYNNASSGITMGLYSSIPRLRTEDGSTVTTINGDTEPYATIYQFQDH